MYPGNKDNKLDIYTNIVVLNSNYVKSMFFMNVSRTVDKFKVALFLT